MSSDNVDRIFNDIAMLLCRMIPKRFTPPLPPDVRFEIARIEQQRNEFRQDRVTQLRMLGLEGFVTP